MKKLTQVLVAFIIFISLGASAQHQVATLHHQGNSTVHYGISALVSAYNASETGDTIILSAGTFNTITNISKGLKIFGVGHYPDTLNTGRVLRTIISNYPIINNGASNLHFEGIYFNADIYFYNTLPVSNIKFRRCYWEGILYLSGTIDTVTIENCASNAGPFSINSSAAVQIKNLTVRNNIFYYYINLDLRNTPPTSTCLIENNIFLANYSHGYQLANSNIIVRNNIFNSNFTATGCLVESNIFTVADFSASQNLSIFLNNYWSVPANSIFVSANINAVFNYNSNYHLQSPTTYPGTDNTEVGIYGGLYPYKERAIPMIPYLKSFQAAIKADSTGALPVSVKVIPQNY